MKVRSLILVAVLALMHSSTWSSPGPEPLQAGQTAGDEFIVHEFDGEYKDVPDVSQSADGRFVVVYQDGRGYTFGEKVLVKARILDGGGAAVGASFVVSENPAADQRMPSVTTRASGGFVVVWVEGLSGIQGRTFDEDGMPVGAAFTVSVSGGAQEPEIAAQPDGSFVVAWSSLGSEIGTYTVLTRGFDADANPVGQEWEVDYGQDVDVIPTSDGRYLVVYQDGAVYSHFLDAQGQPTGEPKLAGASIGPPQSAVAEGGDGTFLVAWDGRDEQDSDGIWARRIDSEGDVLGSELALHDDPASKMTPSVAFLEASQEYLVVWASYGSVGDDSSGWSVQGRSVGMTGELEPQFQVNTFTSGHQSGYISLTRNHGIASHSAGVPAVVVWTNQFFEIRGQLFANPLFADGFESGDRGAWSNSVP